MYFFSMFWTGVKYSSTHFKITNTSFVECNQQMPEIIIIIHRVTCMYTNHAFIELPCMNTLESASEIWHFLHLSHAHQAFNTRDVK